MVLGLNLGPCEALCYLNHASNLFALVIFEIGSGIFALVNLDCDLPIYISPEAELQMNTTMPGLLVEMGSLLANLPLPCWPSAVVLLISTSHVVEITYVRCLAYMFLLLIFFLLLVVLLLSYQRNHCPVKGHGDLPPSFPFGALSIWVFDPFELIFMYGMK
jgi:hypothetical protein